MVTQITAARTTEPAQINEADPRVRRTRALLLQAFTALQKEKSLSSISVQDIAERATVNRATFYAHFEDKYALMDCWIREEFQQVLASRLPAPSGLTVSNLRTLVQTVFDFLAGFYGSCKRSDTQFEPMFETAMQQELRDVLLSWLRQIPSSRWQQAETLETTAQVISWAIFGPAVQWSRGSRARDAEAMAHDVMLVASDALSGAVGPVPTTSA
jgi:AcrR family transcriptional regulator